MWMNQLHDYESLWWIAVWFVICCKPEGVAEHAMKQTYDEAYGDRLTTLRCGGNHRACRLLPQVVEPLAEVLGDMGDDLVRAYDSFEDSFDGSETLLVF